MIERNLNTAKLIQTSHELSKWIGMAFPAAHLSEVSQGVQALTAEAVERAQAIRRPIWLLRIPIWLLIAAFVVGAIYQLATHPLHDILKFLDETKGAAIYIVMAITILVTVEVRWKRRKAIQAVNELRAMVHVVDMHQLAKDEAIEHFREGDHGSPKTVEYLHACTALLALLSKIGQLYVEHFPDNVATEAVNDFEQVTTGLSNKIWMKILSMKRFDVNPAPVGSGKWDA